MLVMVVPKNIEQMQYIHNMFQNRMVTYDNINMHNPSLHPFIMLYAIIPQGHNEHLYTLLLRVMIYHLFS